MSISYSIDNTLVLLYIEDNIKYIITCGMQKGFIYLDNESQKILSINDVIQKILYFDFENEASHITVKFQDTKFFLWFFKSDNDLLIFSIGSFAYRWDKQFERESKMYTIDFSRYIRLLLNIYSDVTLLKLETFSDLIEGIEYVDQKCITALIEMGPFKEGFEGLIDNGFVNNFTFFDENTNQQIIPSAQKYYEIMKANFPIYLYAIKDSVSFKIEIKNIQGFYGILVYPLEPYLMKKGYGSEEEKIDVAFYVQRLLELCENFAIYELKTFF